MTATQYPGPQEAHRPDLTASGLSLAAKCPGSFALAHDDHENPAAEKGTAIHAFIEGVLAEGAFEPEKVEDPAAREVCERLDPSRLIDVSGARRGRAHGNLHVEVPFAYDPGTGEAQLLGDTAHRDYSSAPEGSVGGTADAVALWEGEDGRCLLVTDWKTGSRPVEPPHRNPQLAFLALCAVKAFAPTLAQTPDRGQNRVVAQIAYVDGSGNIDEAAHGFTPEDLKSAEAELRALARSVERSREGEPRLVAGAHCRYCPAFARCPAQAGAAQALLSEKDAALTDAKAGEAWERLQAVEAAAKKVRAALTDYVATRDGAVEIAPGSVLKIVRSRREKIDPKKAMPVLRARFGEGADGAVSVSKTGLKTLAGPDMAAVMAELDGALAVQTAHAESLREAANR